MKTKIGIVEDQKNISDNLVKRFSFFDQIEIVFVAYSAEQALEKLVAFRKQELPSVILMDIELPGMSGIDATAHIKASYSDIDIMMQTVFEDHDRIFKSIQAGASGYFLKDDGIEKYVEGIQDLVEGGAPISASVAAKILKKVRTEEAAKKKNIEDLCEKFTITDRELDILKGIVEDLTEEQIADKLYISPHTVRTHMKNIYKKLHVHSRASAMKVALQHGLIS